MNSNTQKYYQVLHWIASIENLDYKKSEKELMGSVKNISNYTTSTLSLKKEPKKSFYPSYTKLYFALLPIAFIVTFLLHQLTITNHTVVFFTTLVIGILIIALMEDYEKKHPYLLLTEENLTLQGKIFEWNTIDQIYTYSKASYYSRRIQYILVISTKEGFYYSRHLPGLTSINEIVSNIRLFRPKIS